MDLEQHIVDIPQLLIPPTLTTIVSIHVSLDHSFFDIILRSLPHWQLLIGNSDIMPRKVGTVLPQCLLHLRPATSTVIITFQTVTRPLLMTVALYIC